MKRDAGDAVAGPWSSASLVTPPLRVIAVAVTLFTGCSSSPTQQPLFLVTPPLCTELKAGSASALRAVVSPNVSVPSLSLCLVAHSWPVNSHPNGPADRHCSILVASAEAAAAAAVHSLLH